MQVSSNVSELLDELDDVLTLDSDLRSSDPPRPVHISIHERGDTHLQQTLIRGRTLTDTILSFFYFLTYCIFVAITMQSASIFLSFSAPLVVFAFNIIGLLFWGRWLWTTPRIRVPHR